MNKNTLIIENIDDFGVITYTQRKPRFRTRFDNLIEDGEYYEPDTSLTDPTQVLNVKATVEDILRGRSMPVFLPDQYDIKDTDKMSIDEQFDTFDVTSGVGFDLADASLINSQLNQGVIHKSEDSTASPIKQVESEPVVGNSEKIDKVD